VFFTSQGKKYKCTYFVFLWRFSAKVSVFSCCSVMDTLAWSLLGSITSARGASSVTSSKLESNCASTVIVLSWTSSWNQSTGTLNFTVCCNSQKDPNGYCLICILGAHIRQQWVFSWPWANRKWWPCCLKFGKNMQNSQLAPLYAVHQSKNLEWNL